MNIEEDYVSYEVAKLLKEKGFNMPISISKNWICCMYDEYGNIHWGTYDKNWCFRVTHQMACKWLREKDIYICPKYCCFCGSKKKDVPYFLWEPRILRLSTGNIIYPQPLDMCKHYNSYEEAVEAACIYSLENLI